MVNMQSFVKRSEVPVKESAQKPFDPAQFKAELPATKLGKAGRVSNSRVSNSQTKNDPSLTKRPLATGQQGEYDVFGTEAGSIDDSSVGADYHPTNVEDPHYIQEPSNRLSENHHGVENVVDNGGEEDEEEEEEEEEDQPPDVILYTVGGQQHSVSKVSEPDRYNKIAYELGISKIVPKSPLSYPATTSGEPSIMEPEDQDQPAFQEPYQINHPILRGHLPLAAEPIRAPHQNMQYRENQVPTGGHRVLPPSLPGHMQPAQEPQRQEVPRRLPMLSKERASNYQGEVTSHPQVHGQNHRAIKVNANRGKNKHNLGHTSSNDVELGMTTPIKTPDYRTDALDEVSSGAPSLEPQLDYDEEELSKMDFASLQAEDYDNDPRSSLHDFNDITGDDLDKKLAEYSKDHTAQQQKDFFASLNIDQWEEAGDWFQDQFAAMFQKLKEHRREKRKLSYEFETKISQRHQSVVQKRQLTDEALAAMRGAGTHVLNTPKKMQQKR